MVTTERRIWRIERKRGDRKTVVGFADSRQVDAWRSRGFELVEIPLPPEDRDKDGGEPCTR